MKKRDYSKIARELRLGLDSVTKFLRAIAEIMRVWSDWSAN